MKENDFVLLNEIKALVRNIKFKANGCFNKGYKPLLNVGLKCV